MNMHSRIGQTVTANGRDYRWPAEPTVDVCIDASEPGNNEDAIAAAERQAFDPHGDAARRYARGARHRRQLLHRPRGGRGADD